MFTEDKQIFLILGSSVLIASGADSQTTRAIILADSLRLLQKVKIGTVKLRLTCVNVRHPHSKNPVDVLFCGCPVCGCSVMDMLESKEMTEQM